MLHRLDPRTKILLLFLLLIALFVLSSAPAYVLFSALTLLLMRVSGVPAGTLLRSIRPVLWIILFTFVIHIFSGAGEVIARLGPLSVTREGIAQGIFV